MTIGINIIIGIFFSFLTHPLHMSFTNIEFVDSLQRWELTVKLFKDDFGDELSRLYGFEIDEERIDSTSAEAVYRKYLNRYLKVKFDDTRIETNSWVYLNEKENFEAVWLNFYFKHDKIPRSINVRNELMFSLFNDQKNLFIFSHGGKQKAFQFHRKKAEIEFEID